MKDLKHEKLYTDTKITVPKEVIKVEKRNEKRNT